MHVHLYHHQNAADAHCDVPERLRKVVNVLVINVRHVVEQASPPSLSMQS